MQVFRWYPNKFEYLGWSVYFLKIYLFIFSFSHSSFLVKDRKLLYAFEGRIFLLPHESYTIKMMFKVSKVANLDKWMDSMWRGGERYSLLDQNPKHTSNMSLIPFLQVERPKY